MRRREQSMATTPKHTTITLPIAGMDCTSCAAHIEEAVSRLPGVHETQVLFAAERATVTFDADRVTPAQIKAAIDEAGYTVREQVAAELLQRSEEHTSELQSRQYLVC